MKKVFYLTNMPSPYRVDFFNSLGSCCELRVFFEKNKTETRDNSWQSYDFRNFKAYFPKNIVTDKSLDTYKSVIKEYKSFSPDVTVICDYSSLIGIRLLTYLVAKGASYIIEGDGAFAQKDPALKHAIKRYFFTHATKLFYTCDDHKKFLVQHGAKADQLIFYPFSSIHDYEIVNPDILNEKFRQADSRLSRRLKIISVGRFIKFKRFDLLLEAFKPFESIAELSIVGGIPPKEYLDIVNNLSLNNVKFEPFLERSKLFSKMRESDLFVFFS